MIQLCFYSPNTRPCWILGSFPFLTEDLRILYTIGGKIILFEFAYIILFFLVDAKKKIKNHRVKPIRTSELRMYKILCCFRNEIRYFFYFTIVSNEVLAITISSGIGSNKLWLRVTLDFYGKRLPLSNLKQTVVNSRRTWEWHATCVFAKN